MVTIFNRSEDSNRKRFEIASGLAKKLFPEHLIHYTNERYKRDDSLPDRIVFVSRANEKPFGEWFLRIDTNENEVLVASKEYYINALSLARVYEAEIGEPVTLIEKYNE